ncbi:MAG: aminoglycoside phosphotransferase family protein [Phycisphaeraceae bacterium]|nr:aminoglycoside phosphotransferase family protein [Phycisphaerales bacterium]MCB9844346.1 aminoglycoside phosphotransferase family protein [Phycisphaeraceae bacterium]
MSPPPAGHGLDAHDLGPQLAPALIETCEASGAGPIDGLRWFRTDWQRGGAATAYATFSPPDGEPREVVVKFPVGPMEYRFTTGLAQTDAPTPRVVHHGVELGGWDFAWLVMERVPGDPLAAHLHKEVFEELADAAARFYLRASQRWPMDVVPVREDWPHLLDRARENARINPIPHAQEWTNAIKNTQKVIDRIATEWNARTVTNWCHGDLHAGNLMRRAEDSPWGPTECVLLDLAEVHPGHWVEDAVYLERLYWMRPDALKGVKPVSLIARARKKHNLDTSDDYQRLADIRRVLMASCAPAFLQSEGHPRYLEAALGVLEKTLPRVA